MHKLILPLLLVLALLVGIVGTAAAAPARQDGALPPATFTNDEGGAKQLFGSLNYTDFAIPTVLQDPAPTLLDMVHVVQRDGTQFAPIDFADPGLHDHAGGAAALGLCLRPADRSPPARCSTWTMTASKTRACRSSAPWSAPTSTPVRISNSLDQAGDLSSYLTDPTSGEITEGSLLIYAPDDKQGFPSGFGDDGILFTNDDPAVALPQGYTVVHFGSDGFTFDRSNDAELDLIQNPESDSPDFSKQGIVESYNSLIDHLAKRYSFTDLRKLDWEAMRAEFLPQVEEAEQAAVDNPNMGGAIYAFVLHQVAQKVRDAHVMATIGDAAFAREIGPLLILKNQPIATNVGANTVELSDGRIIVTDVITGSPAAEAGWRLGTEIVAVDGTPVADRIPTVYYNETVGTDEAQRLFQVNNLLKFPAPERQRAGRDAGRGDDRRYPAGADRSSELCHDAGRLYAAGSPGARHAAYAHPVPYRAKLWLYHLGRLHPSRRGRGNAPPVSA